MKRSEKAEIIHQTLNKIYKKVPIPLKHRNKFELVIAVLLSAQCTDKRVNQVTPVLETYSLFFSTRVDALVTLAN